MLGNQYRKSIIKFGCFSVATFLLISPTLGDSLPTEFTGKWGYIYERPAESNQNGAMPRCTEREGVEINFATIVWNTEGDCQIERVKRTSSPGRVAVSLICFDREGRVRPKKVRRNEFWSVFRTGDKTFMSQTSATGGPTVGGGQNDLLEKCDTVGAGFLLPSQETSGLFNVKICLDRQVLSAIKTAADGLLKTKTRIVHGTPEGPGWNPEDILMEAVSTEGYPMVFCSMTIEANETKERIVYVIGPTQSGDRWQVKFGGDFGPKAGGHKLFPKQITVAPQ